VSQALAQLLRLATTVVLARLLTPRDFGIVSLAMVVIVLVDHLRDLGVGPAIIQRPVVSGGLLNAVFRLNLGLGLTLAALIAVTARPTAALLGQPSAAPVLQAMGLLTVVSALGQTQQAILRRAMDFSSLAKVAVVEAAFAAAISIVLASAGRGVWSIVVGNIAGAAISTAYLWHSSPWRPGRGASAQELRSIWRFSLHLFGANIAWFIVLGQADKFIIGRWLGVVALGVYALAQRAVSYPLGSVGSVVGQVLFPALSRLQSDPVAMGRVFSRVSAAVALVLFPAMAGAAVVAAPAVEAFLGATWAQLPPLIWVLAPAGAVQAVTSLSYHVTTAVGRTDWTFRWQLVQSVVYVVSFVVGLPHGVVGVAWSYSIACILLGPVGVLISLRIIGFPFGDYLRSLVPIVLATAVMSFVALGATRLVSDPVAQVGLAIVLGITSYLALMPVLKPRAWADALSLVRRRSLK
jgi:PST family polysaccharide transporter